MPTVIADFALSASAVAAVAQGREPAAHERGDHDQRDDDARDRHDLETVARQRADDERKSDPEDGADQHRGGAGRDAGAEDQRHRERKAHAAGIERRKALEQHVDERRERQHEIPARHQRLPGARDFRALHADEAVLAGFQMHHPEGGREIEDGGDRRRLDDFRVLDAERLRHDEGDRAHHRRHDLPAHRGRRLDTGGKGAAIAEPDHQRNRELADGDDVGDAGAGDRAHHARGEHRDLRRSAAGAAEQAERDVGEELDHAGALQERAEQDEQEDVGRRDVDRHAVKAFGAERQMRDDLVEIIAAMVERRRQILPEEPVDETRAAHQRQRRTHQAPRALEDQHREQRADREIEPRRIAVARDQVGIEDPLIEAAEEAGAADHPAERAADIALRGEVGDQAEGEENEEADMDAAHHLARQIVEGGDIELEGGEGDADPVGERAPPARTKAFRKAVLEIVEFNLDGPCGALCLQHRYVPAPNRAAL